MTTQPRVTALGDGAGWIWNLAADHLPQASGVLDIYDLLEHVGEAVKGIGGEENAVGRRYEAARRAALSEGKVSLDRWLGGVLAEVPPEVSTDPLLELAGYVAKHPTRLNCAGRLARGRSIGSGALEQQVNVRLKQTEARWRVEHVGPLVGLRVFSHIPEWQSL